MVETLVAVGIELPVRKHQYSWVNKLLKNMFQTYIQMCYKSRYIAKPEALYTPNIINEVPQTLVML